MKISKIKHWSKNLRSLPSSIPLTPIPWVISAEQQLEQIFKLAINCHKCFNIESVNKY